MAPRPSQPQPSPRPLVVPRVTAPVSHVLEETIDIQLEPQTLRFAEGSDVQPSEAGAKF